MDEMKPGIEIDSSPSSNFMDVEHSKTRTQTPECSLSSYNNNMLLSKVPVIDDGESRFKLESTSNIVSASNDPNSIGASEFNKTIHQYIACDPMNRVVIKVAKSYFFTTLTELRSSLSKRIARTFSQDLDAQVRDDRGVYYLVEENPTVFSYILRGMPQPNGLAPYEVIPGVSKKKWKELCEYYEINLHASNGSDESIGEIRDIDKTPPAPPGVKETVTKMVERVLTMWAKLIEESHAFKKAQQMLLFVFRFQLSKGMCLYHAENETFDKDSKCLSASQNNIGDAKDDNNNNKNNDKNYRIDLADWLDAVYKNDSSEMTLRDLEMALAKRMEFKWVAIEYTRNAEHYTEERGEILKNCFDESREWITLPDHSIFSITIRLF